MALPGGRGQGFGRGAGDETVGDLATGGLEAGIGGLGDGAEAAVDRAVIKTEGF